MKKNIYSLGDLTGILFACNRRYLAHLSALDDFFRRRQAARPRKVEGKTVKGVDFFNPTERTLLGALRTPSPTSPASAVPILPVIAAAAHITEYGLIPALAGRIPCAK
jgi:hypothetical protein